MDEEYFAGEVDIYGFDWPLDRTRVTDDLGAADLMKLQSNMISSIQRVQVSTSAETHSEGIPVAPEIAGCLEQR